MKIKSPGRRMPTDDVTGPNWPGTTDPGFDRPFRNPGGDVGSTTDYVGKKPKNDEPQPTYGTYR